MLINKIYINQYSNLVINKIYITELINKIYMNWYPNSIINIYEWSERVGMGGGRERNRIVRVCIVIEFYIGRAK